MPSLFLLVTVEEIEPLLLGEEGLKSASFWLFVVWALRELLNLGFTFSISSG